MAFARCPIVISVACLACVAAVQVPARHRNSQESSDSCPAEKNPFVLFNHIEKTGGSAMHYLLPAVIGSASGKHSPGLADFKVEDPQGSGQKLSPADKQRYFVIGMVRRPCDHVLSW